MAVSKISAEPSCRRYVNAVFADRIRVTTACSSARALPVQQQPADDVRRDLVLVRLVEECVAGVLVDRDVDVNASISSR
jgi:hypothetical protein